MNAPTPRPRVARDAAERAFRTLMQGLAVTAAAAAATAMAAGLAPGIEWTREYWTALGLSVAGSGITAMVSYVARTVVPPASLRETR